MGLYTPEKDEFDLLTKNYFAARGYVAEIISGAGFSDVVAWQPQKNELAIIDVEKAKSISLKSSAVQAGQQEEFNRGRLFLIGPGRILYGINIQLYGIGKQYESSGGNTFIKDKG